MKHKAHSGKITEETLLAYGAYNQVATSLQHSNRIQLSYKGITSTWLLASFIGMGYSLSTLEVNLPFQPLLVVTVLCLASLLVIGMIWYLDLIVQEKSIASAVHAGLKLEEEFSFLPNAYHNVVRLHYLFGYVALKSIFYLICATILLFTMCAALSFYLININMTWWPVVPVLTFILIPCLFIVSLKSTKKTDPYPILKKLSR